MSDKTVVQAGAAAFSASEWSAIVRDPATRVGVTQSGHLTLLTSDGRTIELPAADALVAAYRDRPWILLKHLEDNRDDLSALNPAAASDSVAATVQRIESHLRAAQADQQPHDRPGETESGIASPQQGGGAPFSDAGDGRAVSGVFGVGSSALFHLGGLADTNLSQISPLKRETAQFGRDDLKRGEVGASGQELDTATGKSLGHLTGLGDEEPGLRNGEKVTSSDNTRFTGIGTGVGSGIDHLWLLGDFEYYRAADDFLSVDEILPDYEEGSPSYGPLLRDDWNFSSIEDEIFSGTLFDPLAFVSVAGIKWTMDPKTGTIDIKPDGTFTFTPANGFSGDAVFTIDLTDPRTGEPIRQEVTIPVAAVADPASIGGAAVTPEDTLVRIPVSLELGDKDGSETIESILISGIPAGAVFGWPPKPGASVVLQPDGSYLITGDTRQVIATLRSLTLLPPDDFSGKITLGIDVTTIESNVPPGTRIITERAHVHHDYIVDVIPVADIPDVTGDIDEVTPEDTRVLLDELAGNLNDLDGSEFLKFEISGVDPNATLEDTAGNEYPFTIAPGGTKTYTIDPANIADVFFNPPPDAFGDFDMTITAIATEHANLDSATNSAPIHVVVTPVADPIAITSVDPVVDEDNPVNFGAGIGITFGDPDGSEVLTDVTVSGFPAGATVTYNDVAGVPQIVVVPVDGFAISLNGGTEAEIRASLATMTVQPPLHSDANIPLNISVTMLDGGVDVLNSDIGIVVQVAAVADVPTLTAPAHPGVEDQDIALPFQVGHPDTDGTEVIENVVIRNVPDGFVLTGAAAGATLTDNGGGTYTVTGSSDAAINALLNTLVLDI